MSDIEGPDPLNPAFGCCGRSSRRNLSLFFSK
jgi:hypothetical protein